MDEITILIIEDDEDIRESVKILLENEGFHVIEADNGMDGLHQISEDTDLVILDIMMPGISGIKTCEQIRKVSYVPILFLTAKSSENDKIIGFTAASDVYKRQGETIFLCRIAGKDKGIVASKTGLYLWKHERKWTKCVDKKRRSEDQYYRK